jgi:hypothetical protein
MGKAGTGSWGNQWCASDGDAPVLGIAVCRTNRQMEELANGGIDDR